MNAQMLHKACNAIAIVLKRGEATHPASSTKHWKYLSAREHVAHALKHCDQFLLGLDDCDHLAHAATRLLLALEQRERGLKKT